VTNFSLLLETQFQLDDRLNRSPIKDKTKLCMDESLKVKKKKNSFMVTRVNQLCLNTHMKRFFSKIFIHFLINFYLLLKKLCDQTLFI